MFALTPVNLNLGMLWFINCSVWGLFFGIHGFYIVTNYDVLIQFGRRIFDRYGLTQWVPDKMFKSFIVAGDLIIHFMPIVVYYYIKLHSTYLTYLIITELLFAQPCF